MWGKNVLRDQLVRVLEPRFRCLNTVGTAAKFAFKGDSLVLHCASLTAHNKMAGEKRACEVILLK